MADKKLNEVPVVSDIVTIFGKRSNGEIVQIDKSNLATLLGELLENRLVKYKEMNLGANEIIDTGVNTGLIRFKINATSASCVFFAIQDHLI